MSQAIDTCEKEADQVFRTVQTAPRKEWIVLKFDGNSVRKFVDNTRSIVESCLENYRAAVICSISSNQTKPYSTIGRLSGAARTEANHCKRALVDIVKDIRLKHITAARYTLEDPDILKKFTMEVNVECESLKKTLHAAPQFDYVNKHTEDDILSKDEKLSSLYIAALLSERGIPTQVIDWSHLISTDVLQKAKSEGFSKSLVLKLRREMEMCENKVPVITGYFENISKEPLSSSGSGNTDVCAVLAAVSVQAKELQIWREVDGIFTADPHKVSTAILIPAVTFSEIVELTALGYNFIHPFAVEQARRFCIAIRIKNIMKPHHSGTAVLPDKFSGTAKSSPHRGPGSRQDHSLDEIPWLQGSKQLTAVIAKRNIVVVNFLHKYGVHDHNIQMEACKIISRCRFSVYAISSFNTYTSIVLQCERSQHANLSKDSFEIHDDDVKRLMGELREIGVVEFVSDMALVSLVGQNLTNLTGAYGIFVLVLEQNNIRIESILQGKPQPMASSFLKIIGLSFIQAMAILAYLASLKDRT